MRVLQALDVSELDEVGTLRKPDFISHPHKYFRSQEEAEAAARSQREKDASPGGSEKPRNDHYQGSGVLWSPKLSFETPRIAKFKQGVHQCRHLEDMSVL